MARSKKKAAAKVKVKAKAKAKAPAKAVAKKLKKKPSATKAVTATPGERFDRAPYELPVMDLGDAIALATALLAAKPARLPGANAAIEDEAAHMAAARDRAKAVLRRHGDGAATTIDARAFDVAMDRAWATFVRRIQDHAELPVERHPTAVEAAQVHRIVSDLSILQLNYLAEFAQIGARLDDLKREGLLVAARTYAGAAFVDEVLHCHAEYGRALGVMPAADGAAGTGDTGPLARGEARNALAAKIAEYTYQVLALARPGAQATWKIVEDALRPVAALRAEKARALIAQAPAAEPAPHPPVVAAASAT